MTKKNSRYRRFIERNDHEGENWWFYIPIKSNEKAIKRLEELFEERASFEASNPDEDIISDTFEFFPRIWTREEIDLLIESDEEDPDTTYMERHNILEGTLLLVEKEERWLDFDEKLYKGSIRTLMVKK